MAPLSICLSTLFSETTGPIKAEFHMEPQWIGERKFVCRPFYGKLKNLLHYAFIWELIQSFRQLVGVAKERHSEQMVSGKLKDHWSLVNKSDNF